MLDEGEYSASSVVKAGTECFLSNFNALSKKKRVKNKRRFSDQQIKSLETIFESESKLEPRKKLQLARELGLQPRQVAIWFQNRRARWKSKQLARDYSILLANYNTLASQFETLKKEKQSLLLQLQKLNDIVEKSNRKGSQCCSHGKAKSSTNCELEDKGGGGTFKAESEEMAYQSLVEVEGSRHGHGVGVLSDEDTDSSIKAEYLGLDEDPELLNMMEPAYSSLTSPENWGSLDSNGLIDQSGTCTSQWWDFWT